MRNIDCFGMPLLFNLAPVLYLLYGVVLDAYLLTLFRRPPAPHPIPVHGGSSVFDRILVFRICRMTNLRMKSRDAVE